MQRTIKTKARSAGDTPSNPQRALGVYTAYCLRTGRHAGYLVADLVADPDDIERCVAFVGFDEAGCKFPFSDQDALALARAVAGTPSLAVALTSGREVSGFRELHSLDSYPWVRGLEFAPLDDAMHVPNAA